VSVERSHTTSIWIVEWKPDWRLSFDEILLNGTLEGRAHQLMVDKCNGRK